MFSGVEIRLILIEPRIGIPMRHLKLRKSKQFLLCFRTFLPSQNFGVRLKLILFWLCSRKIFIVITTQVTLQSKRRGQGCVSRNPVTKENFLLQICFEFHCDLAQLLKTFFRKTLLIMTTQQFQLQIIEKIGTLSFFENLAMFMYFGKIYFKFTLTRSIVQNFRCFCSKFYVKSWLNWKKK